MPLTHCGTGSWPQACYNHSVGTVKSPSQLLNDGELGVTVSPSPGTVLAHWNSDLNSLTLEAFCTCGRTIACGLDVGDGMPVFTEHRIVSALEHSGWRLCPEARCPQCRQ